MCLRRGIFREATMAFIFTKSWDAAIAKNVRDFYDTLSEKEPRRFAAVQARQLGYGSVKYLAKLLGCSRRTSPPPRCWSKKKAFARLACGTASQVRVGDAHGRRPR